MAVIVFESKIEVSRRIEFRVRYLSLHTDAPEPSAHQLFQDRREFCNGIDRCFECGKECHLFFQIVLHTFHGAEFTAHAADIIAEVPFLAKLSDLVRVDGAFDLPVPVEGLAVCCHGPVARKSLFAAAGQISGMGRYLCHDDAIPHILRRRQTEVLRGGHIAEKISPVVSGKGAADCRGDVVIAGRYIGDDRSQHIKGRFIAEPLLKDHICFNLVDGYVSGTFNHDLHAILQRFGAEFPENDKLLDLAAIRGVGNTAGP